jgi:hypothetical protein
MNTGDPRHGTPRETAEHDEIDELFAGANPNPDRIGCPPDSVLVEIAQKSKPQDDPIFNHVERCSPCYQRLRELRSGAGERPARRPATSRWWVAVAAGVLLALTLVGALWWRGTGEHIGPGAGTNPRLVAELDLRPYGASRGESAEGVRPLVLQHGVVDLVMILPTGAEPGHYDIQLLDANLKSRISTATQGVLREYRTELHTTLDLSEIAPGRYQLALRYGTQRWRLFPVEIR